MKRTTLCPNSIYQFASKFIRNIKKHKRGRGRPREYDEALILAIAAVQNLYDLSFREALEFVEPHFPTIPCLSTFHYRVQTLSTEHTGQFLAFLGLQLQDVLCNNGKPLKHFIVDGTGFSFNDVYPMHYLRGTEVRKVHSHVRVLALVASNGKRRFVAGVLSGGPYESEVVMAKQLVSRFAFRQRLPLLGDKAFDAIHFLQLVKEQGCLPAVRIKETHRYGIRDPERVQSAKREKRHGRKRTLIEGLFGNIKEKSTSHIRVFNQHIAEVYGLLRLALYNMYLLVTLERQGVGVVVIFRTGSESIDKK
jgi:DDE family transposase